MRSFIKASVDSSELAAIKRIPSGFKRAARKAGSTALRDMRAEAKKRVRARKRIKAGLIAKAFRMRRPRGSSVDGAEWGIDVSGKPTPLSAYPHRQTRRGVSVEINRGRRKVVPGSFLATMKSGHRGVWMRFGKRSLPIRELIASRPVDALLHEGEPEAVQERGLRSYLAAFDRLLPGELAKDAAKAGGG